MPETPVPIEKNVIKDFGNITPNPIMEPYNAALDAAEITLRITKITSPEIPVQYSAWIGITSKKKALYPKLKTTFPLIEKKDVFTKIKMPNNDAAKVGIVSN